MWGYYCETWCEECKSHQRFCNKCESYYGEGQSHYDCDQKLKALLDKQLSFSFIKE